ncbi:DUF1330 domain-containing protein [Aureispira anguillae]|uniref:DUF1330 domain-containing protein n=1 Tax=Aureispira anguillae TaxID=2864201 RepID=A0A915YDS4_9BACT|nr:DUF1330 domain-containing protein [Aureispira anguillae]BDS11233.1 DUF1330 domain-containing protein [Aureispira anguillae]
MKDLGVKKVNKEEKNQIPAYMVAFVRVEDQETFNRIYLEKSVKIVEKYQGVTVAVADNPPPLEGTLPQGRLVILQFPSLEHAQGFYNDPDYQPLKKARMQISQSDSAVFERGF